MSDRSIIPYEDFGGRGRWMHFAHANGYPPSAYAPLFRQLTPYVHLIAMQMRPLWSNSDPKSILDWKPLADDLQDFLNQMKNPIVIGAGHSMGATTSLRLALQHPGRFRALILLDPVIFPPFLSPFWNFAGRLHLDYRIHPLVRGALKRKTVFDNSQALFENYRTKPVFSRISSDNLLEFIEAATRPLPDGRRFLRYPPAWEARIYVTGLKADLELWRSLKSLRIPLLILRGERTKTFLMMTAKLVQKRLPFAEIITIPDAGHLLPLERPIQVADRILGFLEQHHFLSLQTNSEVRTAKV